MGRIYFTQGDYDRAEGYFQKSLKDTADYNARVRVWSYVRLGMICDARDEREQARDYVSHGPEHRYRGKYGKGGSQKISEDPL